MAALRGQARAEGATGFALLAIGGLAALWGLSVTVQAGLVFGAAPLLSGLLFLWANPERGRHA